MKYKIHIASDRRFWWYKDKLHRENGPAVEYVSGLSSWYNGGKLHREDGPAVNFNREKQEPNPNFRSSFKDKLWYIKGEFLTEAEFNTRMAYKNAAQNSSI